MPTLWSPEVDAILCIGVPLAEGGVMNWALSRQDAINAIDRLMAMDTAILGGDVYAVDQKGSSLTYDNWFCERRPNESDVEFVKRSGEVARTYVQTYPVKDGIYHFAIVPEV